MPAEADADDDRIEVVPHLLPEFRAGRGLVRERIGRVVELVREERAGDLGGQGARRGPGSTRDGPCRRPSARCALRRRAPSGAAPSRSTSCPARSAPRDSLSLGRPARGRGRCCPAVASTIVPPGLSRPSRSAASIIATPMRSLIEPPGFCDSSFRNSSQGPVSRRVTRTSGVLPIRSSTAGRTSWVITSPVADRGAIGSGEPGW